MKDPKFGYHWIWMIPSYYFWQTYLAILKKWFPDKYKKVIG